MNARTLRPMTLLAITLLLSGRYPAAQDANPILGTWVLNVAKSTFSPGPAPRSESRTYIMETEKTKLTARGVTEPGTYVSVRQEIKATSQGVDEYGQPLTREWTIVYDGRDRPMTGDSDVDMLSLRRIDAFTFGVCAETSWKGREHWHASDLARRQSHDRDNERHQRHGSEN